MYGTEKWPLHPNSKDKTEQTEKSTFLGSVSGEGTGQTAQYEEVCKLKTLGGLSHRGDTTFL